MVDNEYVKDFYRVWIIESGPDDADGSAFEAAFILGQSYPSEETARKIWDAATDYWRAEWHEKKNGIIPTSTPFTNI